MIDNFITYLRSIRGYSPNTCRAYERDCRTFAQHMRQLQPNARWSTITRHDLDEYIISQQQAGLSAATTNRQLAAISSMYRYLQREGLVNDNPCRYESRRKQADKVPVTINPKQIQKAYSHAIGQGKLMLGILAGTGIRLQELLDITWQDIDFDSNTIHITGKGRRERIVTISGHLLDSLRQTFHKYSPKGKLFYCSQRQARYIIYHTLAPYCTASQLSPHIIRHTFATELAKAGTSTHEISRILGHKNISTSQKYIDLNQISTSNPGLILT